VPFSPEEVEEKDFLVTLRGYDKDEVRAFLQAVSADYKAALESSRSAGAVSGDAFASLGQEVGHVLQTAKESAEAVRRKADEEAGALRARAEQEASGVRDAAGKAAKRLTEEAEQYAIGVRASADRDATERIRETTRRVERLQTTEAKLRQRLYSLETMLHAIRQDIESAQETDMEENEDLEPIAGEDIPSSTPPAKKSSASDDKDIDESEIRAV
jgi:DivIVA domain-containing protein